MKTATFLFWLLIMAAGVLGQSSDYPVPPTPAGHLFYLQHSRNTNTVMYSVNIKDGKADANDPVKIYWIRYGEKGQKENLTTLQRNFAYGLQSNALKDGSYELNFVSYKKFKFYLRKAADGYHVYAMINKRPAILKKVFLEIKGDSVFSPAIEYVNLNGIDSETGQHVSQRMKIE